MISRVHRQEQNEAFDPEYMKALFEFGYKQTLSGNTWRDFFDRMDSINEIPFPGD